MKITLYSIVILGIVFVAGCTDTIVPLPDKPYHHIQGGFRNPPDSIQPGPFSLKHLWFGVSRPFALLTTPHIPEDHILKTNTALKQFFSNPDKDSITWIGHMTAILRLDNQIIAIDPWFTNWATGIPPFGPKRDIPPGIALHQLPAVHTVVISHNHYDHLDIPTLEQLPNPETITVVVPLGVSRYFNHIQFKEVIELDWHESTTINNISYTALPVVHYSRRTLSDKNETLWAGFSIKSPTGKKIFFCEGEYGGIYKHIGEKYGPFDVALIASGAYLPREVMKGAHCTPEKCVQIGLDIRAKNLVPVHWGTVRLGTEDFMEPGALFREEALKKGVSDERIWIMKIGETRYF